VRCQGALESFGRRRRSIPDAVNSTEQLIGQQEIIMTTTVTPTVAFRSENKNTTETLYGGKYNIFEFGRKADSKVKAGNSMYHILVSN